MKEIAYTNISCGDALNTSQLCEKLGISTSTWKNKKDTILWQLKNHFDFTAEIKGRATIYNFHAIKQKQFTEKEKAEIEKAATAWLDSILNHYYTTTTLPKDLKETLETALYSV